MSSTSPRTVLNLRALFFFEISQHSAGTADLLEQMENFSGNLARNLPYLKRDSTRYRRSTENILPPYTVITPNIGKENNLSVSLFWLEVIRNLNVFVRDAVALREAALRFTRSFSTSVLPSLHYIGVEPPGGRDSPR